MNNNNNNNSIVDYVDCDNDNNNNNNNRHFLISVTRGNSSARTETVGKHIIREVNVI